jgi:phage I-like protein
MTASLDSLKMGVAHFDEKIINYKADLDRLKLTKRTAVAKLRSAPASSPLSRESLATDSANLEALISAHSNEEQMLLREIENLTGTSPDDAVSQLQAMVEKRRLLAAKSDRLR